MSNLKSNCLPENIRKRLAPETRRELKAPTSAESQAKLDGKLEVDLQANIAALLTIRGHWFFWQRMDKRTRGPVGTPDFLVCLKGHFVAFEVKRPGCQPTAEQFNEMEKIQQSGGLVYIVRSESEVVEILNRLEML